MREHSVHSLQLRKVFFSSVLSIDRTCLSWCVELAALELCSASFQRYLHAQVHLLRRIIAKDSANSQTPFWEFAESFDNGSMAAGVDEGAWTRGDGHHRALYGSNENGTKLERQVRPRL